MQTSLSLHYALCFVTVVRKWTNACPKFRSRDNILGYALSSCWLLGWSPLTQRVDCPSQCTDTHTDHLLKHCCIYFPDIPDLISMCLLSGANSASQPY